MANGDWQRRQFDWRDLDPATSGPQNLANALHKARRAEKERFAAGGDVVPLRTAVFVRPNGNGRAIVQSARDPSVTYEVPVSGAVEGFSPGQRVLMGVQRSGETILSEPPAGELGKSATGAIPSTGVLDVYEITSATPNQLAAGSSAVAVTLEGFGFNQNPVDSLTAVKYDVTTGAWVVDTDITIGAVTWVSDAELTTTISVASSAPAGKFIYIDIQRS